MPVLIYYLLDRSSRRNTCIFIFLCFQHLIFSPAFQWINKQQVTANTSLRAYIGADEVGAESTVCLRARYTQPNAPAPSCSITAYCPIKAIGARCWSAVSQHDNTVSFGTVFWKCNTVHIFCDLSFRDCKFAPLFVVAHLQHSTTHIFLILYYNYDSFLCTSVDWHPFCTFYVFVRML